MQRALNLLPLCLSLKPEYNVEQSTVLSSPFFLEYHGQNDLGKYTSTRKVQLLWKDEKWANNHSIQQSHVMKNVDSWNKIEYEEKIPLGICIWNFAII